MDPSSSGGNGNPFHQSQLISTNHDFSQQQQHHNSHNIHHHHHQAQQQQQTNQIVQLENLSNLWINNSANEEENDAAALDAYEKEQEKCLTEHLQVEKDISSQKLFQSFQTSACAVAQMFKDKTQPPSTPWQSFQNSAGAITTLYKDSLEACKAHMELGIGIGQQRKTKEIINWLKKKKRRTIRKDELISILIGKPISINSNGQMSIFGNSDMISTRQQQQQQQLQLQQQSNVLAQRNQHSADAMQVSGQSNCNDANSDLATFREALIMHNRSRDAHQMNNYHHHHHHHHSFISNNTTNNSSSSPNSHQQQHNSSTQQQTPSSAPCDDLDCFFCEQIATHIEHKRSASSSQNNFDMETQPTIKKFKRT